MAKKINNFDYTFNTKKTEAMKIKSSLLKSHVLIIAVIPLLIQCQSGPSRTELKEQADSLERVTAMKDTQMNQMINTIGDIEATLRVIKEKEQLIALKAKEKETDDTSAKEINEDIRLIYDLMVQNKERIETLEKQLTESGIENNRLRKLVDNLNNELKEKNDEIMELNKLLKEKDTEIDDMNYAMTEMEITLDSIKQVNEESREQLKATKDDMHTAYYAIGTKNELKEKNIISKEGFLFFGKTEPLKDNFDKKYFEEIDIKKKNSIYLFQTKGKNLL